MIARDRTRLQAACGDAHERVITRELGGVGAAAQRDSGPSLLEESERVARCRGETRGPSPTLTVPEPTVPESTLPYPTVPEATLPSPTVPEPVGDARAALVRACAWGPCRRPPSSKERWQPSLQLSGRSSLQLSGR